MKSKPIFLTKDNLGESQIGFLDEDGEVWYVHTWNLYKSLFYDVTKDDFVDQVVMLDGEGHLFSDMNVCLGKDDNCTVWIYQSGKCIAWSDMEDFEDPYGMQNNYMATLLSG